MRTNNLLLKIILAIAIAAIFAEPSFSAQKPELAPVVVEWSPPATAMMSYGGPSGNYLILTPGDSQKIEFEIRIEGDIEIGPGDSIELIESRAAFILTPPVGLERDNFDVSFHSNADAALDVKFSLVELPASFKEILAPRPIATIKILSGSMKKGDRIRLSFSDPENSDRRLIIFPKLVGPAMIDIRLRRYGSEESTPFAPPIELDFVGGAPRYLTVVAPTNVSDDDTFDLFVKVEDMYGNPAGNVVEPVVLSLGSKRFLPIELPRPNHPVARIKMSASELTDPVSRFTAKLEGSDIEGVSNPIIKVAAGAPRVYWGDLQCHAYDGVEIGELIDMTDPRKIYAKARDDNALDFLAITPHVFVNHPDAWEEWWPLVHEGWAKENIPGGFVTFMGFEWRGDAGDHNVVFPGDSDGVLTPDNNNIFQLFDEAAAAGAIAIPHFGGIPAEVEYADDATQRVVEITSFHRHTEILGHSYLEPGNKAGFVGSSDEHSGDCGGRGIVIPGDISFPRDLVYGNAYTHGGLAAVRASAKTRESVFGALMARTTYATTGARIYLDFKVNGAEMGTEIELHDSPKIVLDIHGTNALDTVSIVRNNDTIFEKKLDGEIDARIEFTDTDPPYGENFYYARVTQVDDEVAWSSPVFVTQFEVPSRSPYPIVGAWNYDTIPTSSPDDEEAAEAYREKIERILIDIDGDRLIPDLVPLKVVDGLDGRYAVFASYDPLTSIPVRIECYIDRPYRAIRINAGTEHYGQYY